MNTFLVLCQTDTGPLTTGLLPAPLCWWSFPFLLPLPCLSKDSHRLQSSCLISGIIIWFEMLMLLLSCWSAESVSLPSSIIFVVFWFMNSTFFRSFASLSSRDISFDDWIPRSSGVACWSLPEDCDMLLGESASLNIRCFFGDWELLVASPVAGLLVAEWRNARSFPLFSSLSFLRLGDSLIYLGDFTALLGLPPVLLILE